jgi:hypothetical protein
MKKIIKYIGVVCIAFIIRLIIHESGHLVTAIILEAKIKYIVIMPGIKLYPEIALEAWKGWGAAIDYTLENGTPFKSGLIALMGSGSAALVGYLTTLLLFFLKKPGLFQIGLLAFSLICAWDMITYSILPEIGLKHWIFFGGALPEPMIGAVYMGMSYFQYKLLLISHIICSNGLILVYLFRLRATMKTV